MTEANTPAAPAPTGYDTVLQVLADMRKEAAEREAAQAERDSETHRLLEALIEATDNNTKGVTDLIEASKPPEKGASMKDQLKEAMAEGFSEVKAAIAEVPGAVVAKLDEPEDAEATPEPATAG